LFYNSRSAAWYSKVIKVGEMSVFYLYWGVWQKKIRCIK
jgi:hypothetical protein